MTPFQYAKAELIAGRFPTMSIDGAAGTFWLCDDKWTALKGKHYGSKDEAMRDRSKILDRAARKAH